MSGPKSSEYYVSENELRRRQAVQDALQQMDLLEARYNLIKEKITDFDQKPPIRTSNINTNLSFTLTNQNDLTTIEQYNFRLRETCIQLEEELVTQVAKQVFEANLQSSLLEQASQRASRIKTANQEIEASKDIFERQKKDLKNHHINNIQKQQETILRILGRVPGDISPEERQRFENIASSILLSNSSLEMDAYENDLRYKVQLAIEKSKRLANDARKASELLAQLRGYNSTEILDLIEELKCVECKEYALSNSLEERVNAAYIRAKNESDRSYVENSISSTLKEFGYEVEAEFSTMFVSGGAVRIQKPDWGEYFVQFMFSQDKIQINYNVVRLSDNSPVTQNRQIRDLEVENLWCSDFSELNHILEKKGIQNCLIRQEKVGSVPVAVIRDAGTLKSQSQVSKANHKMKKSIK
jgi:hypothetical protein